MSFPNKSPTRHFAARAVWLATVASILVTAALLCGRIRRARPNEEGPDVVAGISAPVVQPSPVVKPGVLAMTLSESSLPLDCRSVMAMSVSPDGRLLVYGETDFTKRSRNWHYLRAWSLAERRLMYSRTLGEKDQSPRSLTPPPMTKWRCPGMVERCRSGIRIPGRRSTPSEIPRMREMSPSPSRMILRVLCLPHAPRHQRLCIHPVHRRPAETRHSRHCRGDRLLPQGALCGSGRWPVKSTHGICTASAPTGLSSATHASAFDANRRPRCRLPAGQRHPCHRGHRR